MSFSSRSVVKGQILALSYMTSQCHYVIIVRGYGGKVSVLVIRCCYEEARSVERMASGRAYVARVGDRLPYEVTAAVSRRSRADNWRYSGRNGGAYAHFPDGFYDGNAEHVE